MTGDMVSLAIECLVAVLLVTTIVYCIVLNRRLTRLRADEDVLKSTIVELVAATNRAERAVATLKTSATEIESVLGSRLAQAGETCEALREQVDAGGLVLQRISKILEAGRTVPVPVPVERPRPQHVPERVPFHRAPGAAA